MSRQSITKPKSTGAVVATVSHSSESDLTVLFVGKQYIRCWCDVHVQNFYAEFSAHRCVGSKVDVEDVHTSGRCGCLISLLTVVKEAIIPVCCVLLYVKFRILQELLLLKRKL
jgi:hypothetical protein